MRKLRRIGELFTLTFRIAHREGVIAAARSIRRYVSTWFRNQWERDRRWQGRILEALGNRSRIDGALIDVSSALIPTRLKGLFLKRNYEWAERRLFLRHFPFDTPVIELGGSLGVVSCITNMRLQNRERHVVVEANPRLIPILRRNRELNRCRFHIVHAALAYGRSDVKLFLQDFTSSNIFEPSEDPVMVSATTVEQIARDAEFDRFNLVCDVEGCEIEMIGQEADFLAGHAAWMIIEMHDVILGKEAVADADRALCDHGFERVETLRNVYCYRNRLSV